MSDVAPLARSLFGPLEDPAAPVLILSHGITDSGACWSDAVGRWTSQGYRVVALDARGHGVSPRWDAPDLRNQDTAGLRLAADLEAAVEDLRAHGLRLNADDVPLGPLTAPVVGVGHSMGGATVLDVASRRPELFEAVVAEDPALVTPSRRRLHALNAARKVRQLKAVAADPSVEVTRLIEELGWPLEEARACAIGSAVVDLRFMALGCVSPPTPWEEVIDALRVPTLVVTGTKDVILRGDFYRELLHRGNAVLSTAVLEGAPHCVRRHCPERFHAVTDPWLSLTLGW